MVVLHKFDSNYRFRKGPLVVSFGKEAAWIKIFHRLDNLHIRYLRSDDLHDSSAGSANLNFQALRTKPTPAHAEASTLLVSVLFAPPRATRLLARRRDSNVPASVHHPSSTL